MRRGAEYEKACLEQRRSFMTLVYSIDGMTGKGARVKVRMALAVVRSKTLLLTER